MFACCDALVIGRSDVFGHLHCVFLHKCMHVCWSLSLPEYTASQKECQLIILKMCVYVSLCIQLWVLITLILKNRRFECCDCLRVTTVYAVMTVLQGDSVTVCLHNVAVCNCSDVRLVIMYLNHLYSFKHQHKAIWGSVVHRHRPPRHTHAVSGDWREYIRIDPHRKTSDALTLPHTLAYDFLHGVNCT